MEIIINYGYIIVRKQEKWAAATRKITSYIDRYINSN